MYLCHTIQCLWSRGWCCWKTGPLQNGPESGGWMLCWDELSRRSREQWYHSFEVPRSAGKVERNSSYQETRFQGDACQHMATSMMCVRGTERERGERRERGGGEREREREREEEERKMNNCSLLIPFESDLLSKEAFYPQGKCQSMLCPGSKVDRRQVGYLSSFEQTERVCQTTEEQDDPLRSLSRVS